MSYLLFMFILSSSLLLSHGDNNSDYAALLAFKSHLTLEANDVLSQNWTSNTHFCSWLGVSCFKGRVVALGLQGLELKGRFPLDIANLSELSVLDLSSNDLEGPLPDEIGSLQKLRFFNVTQNQFHGRFPGNISRCQKLEELYISHTSIIGSIPEELGLLYNLRALRLNNNNLTGNIPASLGNLSKLEFLYIHENDLEGEIPLTIGDLTSLVLLSFRGNSFSGSIPASLFNISTLSIVDLSLNKLSGQLPESFGNHHPNMQNLFLDTNRITGKIPVGLSNATKLTHLYFTENDLRGNIPDEFGKLQKMQWFEFEFNQISGNIPHSIFNISSLKILKARHNYLNGYLSSDLGNWLPNLTELFLSHNQFSGMIPPSICNATKLVHFEVSNNSFSGPIPEKLGNLVDLEHLVFQSNRLVNNPKYKHLNFLNSLVNCRKLEYLILDNNPLNGVLPESVGNLSTNIKVITALSSKLKGNIPPELGNLSSLYFLGLASNSLEGSIPSSLGKLQNLERLYLTGNEFRGVLTTELCNIKRLGILHLGENNFSGYIPSCLGNLTNLNELSLAANNFYHTVPLNFWGLVKLNGLNLSRNMLQGSLPPEMGKLEAVRIVDLSSNNFAGELPGSLGSLQSLISLDLSNNSFSGQIPNIFSKLIPLEALDLSFNTLSGEIPQDLESLPNLEYLNLSFNMLEGKIPDKGVFSGLEYQSLMGNTKLCGAPRLNFSTCPTQEGSSASRKRTKLILKITIPILSLGVLLVCILTWINLSRRKRTGENVEPDSPVRMFYQRITYLELKQATNNFSEENILGSGSSGRVYKGVFSDGTVAAVKVLDLERERAIVNFESECEVLSNARHRNLVKIISICSNMEFKALVLEFMPNGSLDNWLYSENKFLSLVERLNILTDVALAMEYLHHDYVTQIVHCDLKPNNVLLDDDMTAHLADFGIAKILAGEQSAALTRTLGTIGYIAPESGLDGHVSTSSDVYSFGVLLLETFTRKKPTDYLFKDHLSLHEWAKRSYPATIKDVLDPDLCDEVGLKEEDSSSNIQQLVLKIFYLAFQCLKGSPDERMDMKDVVVNLKKIKAELSADATETI